MIGVNKGADALASEIDGQVKNPFAKEPELNPVHYILFICTLSISLLIIMILLIYRARTQPESEGITSRKKKTQVVSQEDIGNVIACVNDSLVEEDVEQIKM